MPAADCFLNTSNLKDFIKIVLVKKDSDEKEVGCFHPKNNRSAERKCRWIRQADVKKGVQINLGWFRPDSGRY